MKMRLVDVARTNGRTCNLDAVTKQLGAVLEPAKHQVLLRARPECSGYLPPERAARSSEIANNVADCHTCFGPFKCAKRFSNTSAALAYRMRAYQAS